MEVIEKKRERSPSCDGGRRYSTNEEETIIVEVENGRVSHEKDGNSKPSSPQCKSISPSMQGDNHLESARAEMGEVRQENQRLKIYLERIMKDYKTLQMQFDNIVKQDQINKNNNLNSAHSTSLSNNNVNQETTIVADESDLVCLLSLGRVSSNHSPRKDDHQKNKSITSCDDKLKLGSASAEKLIDKEGLALSLDCKFEPSKSSSTTESMPVPPRNRASPTNSFGQDHKEDAGETWPPSKVLKTMKSITSGDDEVSQQNPVKKARVSVRARCDTPTMNDGCQWRKYGQKIAKGNPCPRAYYRCTVAPSCPVRKQVQRCADDMSILITTYEGTHNHPLPMSATAMASTTSAAASMLLSGSSSSQPGSGSSVMANNASSLRGFNFYLSDASKTKQFYIPNSSSISTSPSFPTITLDLTSNSFSYPTSSSFNGYSSTYPSTSYSMNNTSTSLSFGSSDASNNTLPISWSNNGVLNYGSSQALYNKNQGRPTLLDIGRQMPQEGFYQSYFHNNKNPNASSSQEALPDTIAAATKAITANPNFHTVLAAALKSIISNNGNNVGALGNQVGDGGSGSGDNLGQKLRWSNESFPMVNTQQVNGCASSYLNKSSATSSQPGSLTFLPPALPFFGPKSAATSPCENRDRSSS